MKIRFLSILILTFFSNSIFAQVPQAEIDNLQSKFADAKKGIVVELIPLREDQKDDFWKLYEEYDSKRKEIGKERLVVVLSYVDNNLAMNDEDLNKEVLKFIKVKSKTNSLIEKYYKKINNKFGGKVASKFYMVEVYFQSQVVEQFGKHIPFMVELDNKYKGKQ